MIPEILGRIRQNRLASISTIVVLGLLILLLVLLLQPDDPLRQHKLVKTNLTAQDNFGYLSGSDIFAFNGLAFYKVDLSDNSTSVLHAGTKLPTPSNVIWANDQGALLNFEESFLLSAVYDRLRDTGNLFNISSRNYTWYLDFDTGALKLVGEPSIRSNLAVFSEQKNGFYYVPDFSTVTGDGHDHSDIPEEAMPLYFYDIKTGKNETISEDMKVYGTNYLGMCSGQQVCIIARGSSEEAAQKLFTIESSGQKKRVGDIEGRLLPTNNPDLFVSIDLGEAAATEGAVFTEEPAYLHNIKSGSVQELGFDIGDSNIVARFDGSGEFFVLDSSLAGGNTQDDDNETVYRSGQVDERLELLPLTYLDDKPFVGSILELASHGSGGNSLIASVGGDLLLFTPNEQELSIATLNQQKAQKIIEDCMSTAGGKENQYFESSRLFKVFFADNENFADNIKTFSGCVVDAGFSQAAGFNFYFGALDPVNGRITTD